MTSLLSAAYYARVRRRAAEKPSTFLIRFHNRNLESRGSDLPFLPTGERNNDLGFAFARFDRDPHGAIEGVPSAAFI
jgi:hypothetical protein